ncbi:MAG: hypothetical protein WBM70_06200 [Sulfurovum sp.]|jgi:uncharacterized tellurite resistance protein B-like protein|uniref:hypothetical protein n=1 Tax=Sulfurovum sp. TaxID=1969726 RepID=UPI003C762490
MSKNELIDQKLDEKLERYYYLKYLKEESLEDLIMYAEKEHWESIDNIHRTNDLTRIIELAETLTETEAA